MKEGSGFQLPHIPQHPPTHPGSCGSGSASARSSCEGSPPQTLLLLGADWKPGQDSLLLYKTKRIGAMAARTGGLSNINALPPMHVQGLSARVCHAGD